MMADPILQILPLVLYAAPMVIGLSIRRPSTWGLAYFASLLLPLVNIAAVIMALHARGKRTGG